MMGMERIRGKGAHFVCVEAEVPVGTWVGMPRVNKQIRAKGGDQASSAWTMLAEAERPHKISQAEHVA